MSIILRECWKTTRARKLRARTNLAIPQSSVVPEQVVTPISPGRASPFGMLPRGAVAEENVLVNIMQSTQADAPVRVILSRYLLDFAEFVTLDDTNA